MKMRRPVIKHKVVFGDSLSDRGLLGLEELLAFGGGLTGESPRWRFANGFGWVDLVASFGMAEFTVNEFKARRKELLAELDELKKEEQTGQIVRSQIDTIRQIVAQVDDNDLPELFTKFRQAFNLDNPRAVLYNGERYIRTYAIGGATAAVWGLDLDELVEETSDDISRLLLANLKEQRKELFADDRRYRVTDKEKEETLVVDLSGANDLITVNDRPTKKIADEAIKARIENIKELIEKGYRNFVLINLPDFSLTPRFQNSSEEERENAHEVIEYFNRELARKVEKLKAKYDEDCFFDIFDVNGIFVDAYEHPEKYGFDPELLTQYYTESKELEEAKGNQDYQTKKITPDTGYISLNLYFREQLPEQTAEYKNSYILCNDEQLYYIDSEGKAEQVTIEDFERLESGLEEIKKVSVTKDQIRLTTQQIKELITDNGGHKPPLKGYQLFWNAVHPSAYVQAILGVKFSEKYDEVFDYRLPWSKIDHYNSEKYQQFLEYKKRLNVFSDRPVSDEKAWEMFEQNQKILNSPEPVRSHVDSIQSYKHKHHAPIPKPVQRYLNAIQEHANGLANQFFNKELGKEKAKLLNGFLAEVNEIAKNDSNVVEKLKAIKARLNNFSKEENEINKHQNPKLDNFFKEDTWTTSSFSLLNNLNKMIDDCLQKPEYRGSFSVETDISKREELSAIIQKIEQHYNELASSSNPIAKNKAVVLEGISSALKEVDPHDPQEILKIINNIEPEDLECLRTKQNATWDALVGKKSTAIEDLLQELKLTATEALIVIEENLGEKEVDSYYRPS
jgi:ribosomal protein L29